MAKPTLRKYFKECFEDVLNNPVKYVWFPDYFTYRTLNTILSNFIFSKYKIEYSESTLSRFFRVYRNLHAELDGFIITDELRECTSKKGHYYKVFTIRRRNDN